MRHPDHVEAALAALRKQRGNPVVARAIGGRYYAYEEVEIGEGHARRHLSRYLGRINADGSVRAPRRAWRRSGDAAGIGASQGATGAAEIDLLRIISTDGRATISAIASRLSMSRAAVRYRLRRLEQAYAIKYTLEFMPRPFGLFRYIVLVRFEGSVPRAEEMKRLLSPNPMVQFVALAKGDYHLIIYLLAENTQELDDIIYEMRSSGAFAAHTAHWYVSYITYAYGYVPFRREFVEWLASHVWKRSRDSPRRRQGQLLPREYNVIKELNEDGSMAFSDIDKKYGMNEGAADYTYGRLKANGMIKRVTITMGKLPHKYAALVLMRQINIERFNKRRADYMRSVLRETGALLSRYVLVGDTGAPYGILHIAPIFADGELEALKESIRKMTGEVIVDTAVITEFVIGSLGYRYIDIKETEQYKYLKEHNEAL